MDGEVNVKQNRDSAAVRQRRSGQYSRAVHVDQVEGLPIQQPADYPRLAPRVHWKPKKVRGALASGAIRTARDRVDADVPRTKQIDQGAVSGEGRVYVPAAALDSRQQVEQAPLRAAQLTELVKKEDVHESVCVATANTKKYTGKILQKVSRSTENICTTWPAQKQNIHVPQNARRGSAARVE